MAAQTVCLFNKYGFCKFKERCLKLHIDDNCADSSCNTSSCNRRHPKECRYYRRYRRCKFDPCKFLHKENNIDEILKTKESIDLKLKIIDDEIKKLNEKIVAIENSYVEKNQHFMADFENRLEIFETNLKTSKIAILEKDNQIQSLELKVSKIEEENKDQSLKIQSLIQELKILSEASNNPITQFKCRNCDFETTSEKGLKQHNSKKHTKSENKGKRFECKHCKYGFNSKETLDVHIGKTHTKDFKCGLCEKVLGSKEALEIHLNLCEVYQCTKCQRKETNFSDIKQHIINQHNSQRYLMIDNYKLSRENWEEVTWKEFYIQFE